MEEDAAVSMGMADVQEEEMSTSKRPGMAINEEELERHVKETREQAKRAHYPRKATPLHGKAAPTRKPPTSRPDRRPTSAEKR